MADPTLYDSGLTVFKLNDGSSLRDISPNITNCVFDRKFDFNDVTTFGNTGHRWSKSLENSVIKIEGWYNNDATVGIEVTVGALANGTVVRAFELYPYGGTFPKYTGSIFAETFTITARIGNKVAFAVNALIDGVSTRALS